MSTAYEMPRRSPRWLRLLIGLVLVVIAVFVLLTIFAGIFTDGLWYHSVDESQVFAKLFWTKLALFLIFGFVMSVAVAASMVVAFHTRPLFRTDEHGSLERYRAAIAPVRRWLVVGISALTGIIAGVSAEHRWHTFLLWHDGVRWGRSDPYFHKDIGFYVFSLPWWHFIVGYVQAVSIMTFIVGLLVHYLFGGVRLAGGGERFSGAAQAQLSALLGIFVLAESAGLWLGRYDLVHADNSLMTGMSYTDAHAVLPAKNILAGIALICALLFFVNVWRRTWQLPVLGLALLVLSSLLLGLIWPAIVQTFQVKPSQSDKEASYLASNIAGTRRAYGIDNRNVTVENYDSPVANASRSKAGALSQQLDRQLSSAPIVDPGVVTQQFEQTQQGKSYFTVSPELDLDHYDVDGKQRAVVVGARELSPRGIGAGWTNLHTVYTHSDGLIAAFANQRDVTDATESPDIQWAEGLDASDITHGGVTEQQIYYGQSGPQYSIVGRAPGTSAVELDLAPSGQQRTTTYAGSGGVPISSTFRRMMYAIKYGSANFLLSERVNANSKVLDVRDPMQRVAKVAPWLTLDGNPYPTVVNGHIDWVVDGYTTTNNYPESQRESFSRMTTDSATQVPNAFGTVPSDRINYIRNSVKATVDAYNGTVTLYAWDSDPILKAWERAFPGVVRPRSAIPKALKDHLRYPDDLYKVQRYQLARYHVTNPVDFLQYSDRWAVPQDPNFPGYFQAPVRMFLGADGKLGAGAPTAASPGDWSITSVFVPYGRTNLQAVMSVDSNANSPDYGHITVMQGLAAQAQGPAQVSNAFHTSTRITNAITAFSRSGSNTIYGNILTIATAKSGLIYVEPVYATPPSTVGATSYSELAYVLVDYDNQLGYGRTLDAAIENALTAGEVESGGGSTNPPPPPSSSSPSASTSTPGVGASDQARAAALLDQARSLFTQADAAGRAGRFAQREELIAQAEKKVALASALLGPALGTSSGAPTP